MTRVDVAEPRPPTNRSIHWVGPRLRELVDDDVDADAGGEMRSVSSATLTAVSQDECDP